MLFFEGHTKRTMTMARNAETTVVLLMEMLRICAPNLDLHKFIQKTNSDFWIIAFDFPLIAISLSVDREHWILNPASRLFPTAFDIHTAFYGKDNIVSGQE